MMREAILSEAGEQEALVSWGPKNLGSGGYKRCYSLAACDKIRTMKK